MAVGERVDPGRTPQRERLPRRKKQAPRKRRKQPKARNHKFTKNAAAGETQAKSRVFAPSQNFQRQARGPKTQKRAPQKRRKQPNARTPEIQKNVADRKTPLKSSARQKSWEVRGGPWRETRASKKRNHGIPNVPGPSSFTLCARLRRARRLRRAPASLPLSAPTGPCFGDGGRHFVLFAFCVGRSLHPASFLSLARG